VADDRDKLIQEVKSLTWETKRDLLKAIQARADGAPAGQLAALAYAFAAIEGAKLGVLPGSPLDTK
jgi:hypothetical protein